MKERIKGVEIISERFFNGRQSVEFTGVYKIGEDKVRVSIDIDSYDFQSSANVKVYEPNKKAWNFLEKIPYNLMTSIDAEVFSGRKVKADGTGFRPHEKTAIDEDINELLERAKDILL